MAKYRLIRLATTARDMTTRWFQASEWNGKMFKHTKYDTLPRLLYIFKRTNYKGEVEYANNIECDSDFAHDNLEELENYVDNWWDPATRRSIDYERELDLAIHEAIAAHMEKWTRKLEDDINNNLVPAIRARTKQDTE
jgi:hypothetical protein